MLTMHHDQESGLTVEIPDAQGEVHLYPVHYRLRPGGPRWYCQVGPYELSRYLESWGCTCPAYRFGRGMPCKHCRAVRELEDFLCRVTEEDSFPLVQQQTS